jgi:hypothetical protein
MEIVYLTCGLALLIQILQKILHLRLIWSGLVIVVNGILSRKQKKKKKKKIGENIMVDKILLVNERHAVVYFTDRPPIIVLGENALDAALLIAKGSNSWYSHLRAS